MREDKNTYYLIEEIDYKNHLNLLYYVNNTKKIKKKYKLDKIINDLTIRQQNKLYDKINIKYMNHTFKSLLNVFSTSESSFYNTFIEDMKLFLNVENKIYYILQENFKIFGYTFYNELEDYIKQNNNNYSLIQIFFRNYLFKLNRKEILFFYFTENIIPNTTDLIYNIETKKWRKALNNEKLVYYDYIHKKKILKDSNFNKFGLYIIINSNLDIKENMSILFIDQINKKKEN